MTWDESRAESAAATELFAAYRALARRPGRSSRRRDGDRRAALARRGDDLRGGLRVALSRHAPMEPLDASSSSSPDGCEIWAGSQMPDGRPASRRAVARPAAREGRDQHDARGRQLRPPRHAGRPTSPARRPPSPRPSAAARRSSSCGRARTISGAAAIARSTCTGCAGLDATGRIVAWEHRIVGQSIMKGTPFERRSSRTASTRPRSRARRTALRRSRTSRVDAPHGRRRRARRSGGARSAARTPRSRPSGSSTSWRTRPGTDPLEVRRELLAKHPRHLGVLELAAEKAGWGKPLPAGRARGVASARVVRQRVAQVAEVSLGRTACTRSSGWSCAVDCGDRRSTRTSCARRWRAASAIGLGAALYERDHAREGRVDRRTSTTTALRIDEMPARRAHRAATEAPTGVGEPGVPPHRPRRGNALFRLTGKRVRPAAVRAARHRGDADDMMREPFDPLVVAAVAAVGGARRLAAPAGAKALGARDAFAGHSPIRPRARLALRRGGQGAAAPALRQLPSRGRPAAAGRRRSTRASRPSSAATRAWRPRHALRRPAIQKRTSIRPACPAIPSGTWRRWR